MDNLEARVTLWNECHIVERQGASPQHPFTITPSWEEIYSEKTVLEIGPGEGRQTKELKKWSLNYYIADICQSALDKHDVTDKFLLNGWDNDLGMKFDVICFWYVLHHITRMESGHFLKFLHRHLNPGGYIHFNYPHYDPSHKGLSAVEGGDGLKTTDWKTEIVRDIICRHHFVIKYNSQMGSSDSSVILAYAV